MPFDPRSTDRAPQWRPQLQRRDVLRGGAFAAAGLGAAPLLAACGGDDGGGPAATGPTHSRVPTTRSRCRSSTTTSRSPTGLQVEKVASSEGAELRRLHRPGGEEGLRREVRRRDPGHAVQQLRRDAHQDHRARRCVRRGVPGAEPCSAAWSTASCCSRFSSPICRTSRTLWPEYQDPWYDQGSQYTVPYVVYTTGIGYRADRVSDPSEGYMMLWNEEYAGQDGRDRRLRRGARHGHVGVGHHP